MKFSESSLKKLIGPEDIWHTWGILTLILISYRDIYFRVDTLKQLCEGYFAPFCLITIIILIMFSMTMKGETVKMLFS